MRRAFHKSPCCSLQWLSDFQGKGVAATDCKDNCWYMLGLDAHERHMSISYMTQQESVSMGMMQMAMVYASQQCMRGCSDVATTAEEHGADGHRFNDGKPGPAGVCILGRKHESSEGPDGQRGRVYRLDLGPDVSQGRLSEASMCRHC